MSSSDESRWGFSQTFLSQFNASKACIEDKASQGKRNEAQEELLDLSKQLNEANEWLPAFDQRNCQIQLDQLRVLIADEAKEKPRFSFKRRAKPASSSAVVTTIPATSTPSVISMPVDTNTVNDINRTYLDLSTKSPLSGIHIHSIRDSIVRLPDIQVGSAILHDIQNSAIVFTGTCHQFRLHQASSVIVIFERQTPLNPVIEESNKITFMFPLGADVEVKDFSHVKETPSPNWSVVGSKLVTEQRENESVEETLKKVLPLGLQDG
ncbi:hypothetical protein PM082_010301 [Marasmius tenuissimus]|nr:hypothetical protein PM082_010301 [Marasmius tenuissimus]